MKARCFRLSSIFLTDDVLYNLWFFTSRIQSRKQWYFVLNLQYLGILLSTLRHPAHNRNRFRIFCLFMSEIARFSAHGNLMSRNDCRNNCLS